MKNSTYITIKTIVNSFICLVTAFLNNIHNPKNIKLTVDVIDPTNSTDAIETNIRKNKFARHFPVVIVYKA
jgi:hypothetical protein